jgi:uncharacterized secreted protein with C-terminal beta-propeller domain
MSSRSKRAAFWLTLCMGVTACGGSSSPPAEEPVNIDYSSLRFADSSESTLVAPGNDEQVLRPLRNGLRLGIGQVSIAAAIGAPAGVGAAFSSTTVQVNGVDETDAIKYDGRHIYIANQAASPPITGLTRNVLKIARTNPSTAGIEWLSDFTLEGTYNARPSLYQVSGATGSADYIVALSQNYQGWFLPQPTITSLVVTPDRTSIQLLDVRDPYNVSQAWSIELDGWLRASRKIGDTLYLVSNYRPRLAGITFPADTIEKREANERRIRSAAASELLPRYRVNGISEVPLARPDDCVIAAGLGNQEAYADLLLITAIDVAQRRVTSVKCLSANFSGVYMSTDTLYVGGAGRTNNNTVLHKFMLAGSDIVYRASGVVDGSIGWQNPSYFMDEYRGDLRIVTTQYEMAGPVHRLSVLRESNGQRLSLLSTLPNAARPAPIGKPLEAIHAVRFVDERAYVVTARLIDPLYAIDLSDPAAPAIAGELEIPGISTYLHPLGAAGSQALLAVGQQMDAGGRMRGVKVELFDVSDISRPRSAGAHVFGDTGSRSEAVSDPHALSLLTVSRSDVRYRVALPIDVFSASRDPLRPVWSYSGLHLLEIEGIESGSPQLRFKGAIKTAISSGPSDFPRYVGPQRGVMHDDSVFAVVGADIVSSLWDNIRAD